MVLEPCVIISTLKYGIATECMLFRGGALTDTWTTSRVWGRKGFQFEKRLGNDSEMTK